MGIPATEGNAIDVLRNGDEIFPAMLESIAAARKTIDFLTFVYWEGEIGRKFAEALSERAEAGVRVRVLLDGFGALSIEKELVDLMTGAGVDVQWFRRLGRMQPHKANHRTHRKVLVVDEEVAFTGGVGIADEWQGDARDPSEWRDTHFRLRGPAVDGLRAAFLNNWVEAEDALFDRAVDRFPDQPQPGSAVVQCVRGASSTGWSDVSTLFRTLLAVAEQRVRITTAYFVPDERLNDQLCSAADRGVKLDILIPGPYIDKRFVQLAGEASYERTARARHRTLALPALDAAREGHDRRRRRGQHRVRQPERALGEARRGDQRRRPGPGPGRHPRRPLRRGPRAQRARGARELGRTVLAPAGAGAERPAPAARDVGATVTWSPETPP